jgi:hypothetical protein
MARLTELSSVLMQANGSDEHISDTHCTFGPDLLPAAVPSANRNHARTPLPPNPWMKHGAALSLMDLPENFLAFFRFDTTFNHTCNTSLVHLVIDDGICLGSSLNTSGFILIFRHISAYQEIHDWLRPGWHNSNGEYRYFYYHHLCQHTIDLHGLQSPWD